MMPVKFYLLLAVIMMAVSPMRQVFATEEKVSDVRILIDVSGSMKKNDPNNLRSPALEMIVGLLPEGAKAGVWTFAKYVNMLVPYNTVTTQWRQQAERQTTKIHAKGLFTNIEQALNKATANQHELDNSKSRNVILLSDGLVDIEPDEKRSQISRQRILSESVPRLKHAGVAVHTIALADSADHELLREIALATDGWYEQVDNAEQLQRVFLHLFEKATGRDTVPLTDNHFKIDDSVTQMTVLVFRKNDSKDTELLMPDQSRISAKTVNDTFRWRHNQAGYDMVTIDNPQAGAWYIDADIDPDNRVMVLTDLKLNTSTLPNNIVIGEHLDFNAQLTSKDSIITRQDFHQLLSAKLRHENEWTKPVEIKLNEHQQKGIYSVKIGETFKAGRNDIVTMVSSGTFERQRRQSINAVEVPFAIDTEQLFDGEMRAHRITLKPDLSLIKEDSLSISVLLSAEDGSEWSYDVMKTDNNLWQLTVTDLFDQQLYDLDVKIRAETLTGRSLFVEPETIQLYDEAKVIKKEQQSDVNVIETDPVAKQPDITDELTANTDDLLPEIESDVPDLALAGEDETTGQAEQNKLSLSALAIGNAFIAMLFAAGAFIWRRQAMATRNPGDQL